jgi:signal transduction histidine kinase
VARLHTRVYLHFLGVLLVVGLATSAVFAFGARAALLQEVTSRIARHVGALVGESLDDRPALARRLQRLHDDFEVDLTVRGRDGRVIVAAGPTLPPLTAAQTTALLEGRTITAGRPEWFAASAVRDPGSAAVVATLQASAPRHFRRPGVWRPLLSVALVLLIVTAATRPLARRISRPLERLTEAARRLGGGDLAARVPANGGARRWWRRRARHADELTELSRAFNEMAERLERLVRGQKELLANVSHELRSPLARIRVALALLPRTGDAEARLGDVELDLAELDRLIDDVLAAARLEATGVPARLERVEVGALLAEVAERARRDPVTASSTVRVADARSPSLMADPGLLRRALWNLVENAAKYGAPPITLGAASDGTHLALSVTDEGEGIPADERARVLDPFYRLDPARTPASAGARPGVGLGLTLARRIAEVHGGTIAIGPASVVEGREHGCRVTITLPLSA